MADSERRPKWIDEIVLEVREERAPWSPGRVEAARRAAAREAAEHAETGEATVRPLEDAAHDLLECQIPGRGGASVCDACLDRFAVLLRGVPLLVADLNLTRVARRGADLNTAHPDHAARWPKADNRPLPLAVDRGAVGARDRLRSVLWQAVVGCADAQVQHTSHHAGLPHRGDVPAQAEWLLWRVDNLTRHPTLADVPADVARAVKRVLAVIDQRPPGSLVKCAECTLGWIEVGHGDEVATCPSCGATHEAQLVRDRMLDNIGDQLLTAGEIADLAVVHLGLRHDSPRDVLRKRINKWAERGVIASHPGPGGTRHRFGEVRTHLVAFDQRHEHSWGPWEKAGAQPGPDLVLMVRRCQFEGCDEIRRRNRPAPKASR